MLDLIIKNGQCYINGKLKDKDIAIKDGKIFKIGEILEEAKEVYNAKKQIVERDREKRTLDKLMLEAYYAKLDQYAIYTRNSQLQRMEADQGKILDIEIK